MIGWRCGRRERWGVMEMWQTWQRWSGCDRDAADMTKVERV